jgi:Flp pilus assembly protein TadG
VIEPRRLRLLRPRKSKGQSLAEFALVLPVLALLLFALLDLGRAVYMYNTLANSARAGARVAAVNQYAGNGVCDPTQRNRWSIVQCVMDEGVSIPVQKADIDIKYIGTSCVSRLLDPPCIAEVTVFQTYTPFTPIIGDLIGPIQLRASSDMPVEAWYP